MTPPPDSPKDLGRRAVCCALALLGLMTAPHPAGAQNAPAPAEVPKEAREASRDLDVPYEASTPAVVRAMFALAKPTRDDFVIDLGSGDGRINIAAARHFGARGFGVDLNEKLVAIARARAQAAGVGHSAEFFVRDIFETDIRQATVLTMFLFPKIVLRLRPKLLAELSPGARVVSNEYHLGAWRPDAARVVTSPGAKDGVVYLWVVPARLAGLWRWEVGNVPGLGRALKHQGAFRQRFQDISGSVETEHQVMDLHDATLKGAELRFSVTGEIDDRMVRHDFAGRVTGKRITGTVRLSGGIRPVTLPWQAWRAGDLNR